MLGTVANLEAYQVVTTPARVAAADRAEQIRLGLQSTAVLYAKAVDEEDWRVLGYSSVTDWAAKEFGPDRFSTERRREIVALLTDAGFTVRQIAKATGAGKSTVARDQREAGSVPDGTPDYDGGVMLVSDNQQVSNNQSPRQQASRNREAARREHRELVPDEGPVVTKTGRVLTEDDLQRLADEAERTEPRVLANVELVSVSLGMRENPFNAAANAAFARPRKLGDEDIEVIIAGNLTRGQIRDRFGVGEHAAQLARVAAVTIARERSRARPAGLDMDALRERAEAWLAYREGLPVRLLGTDRTKVTLFLDWLAAQ